jgi:hypothetical protein
MSAEPPKRPELAQRAVVLWACWSSRDAASDPARATTASRMLLETERERASCRAVARVLPVLWSHLRAVFAVCQRSAVVHGPLAVTAPPCVVRHVPHAAASCVVLGRRRRPCQREADSSLQQRGDPHGPQPAHARVDQRQSQSLCAWATPTRWRQCGATEEDPAGGRTPRAHQRVASSGGGIQPSVVASHRHERRHVRSRCAAARAPPRQFVSRAVAGADTHCAAEEAKGTSGAWSIGCWWRG